MSGQSQEQTPDFRGTLRKYFPEIILVSVSVIISAYSAKVVFFTGTVRDCEGVVTVRSDPETAPASGSIQFDISGSVLSPGLYKASSDARLNDAVDKAGGLSEDAAVDYFHRNFNLSRKVYDQEKIYIPSVIEINNGEFKPVFEAGNFPGSLLTTKTLKTPNSTINVNTATESELDGLPGIGPATARKIIENRPFKALEELILRKVISEKIYRDISYRLGI